ncbi:MAG TPA: hypothetical protein VHJ38_10890 [Nitrososphaeraceae archaeon]|jgi:hypothetical protein|nr:hypothetical protein [Nitrososphaeraceae archaeon]
MNYRYDDESFRHDFNNLWKIIDLSFSVAILGGCFYGYSNTKEFLEKIQNIIKRDLLQRI